MAINSVTYDFQDLSLSDYKVLYNFFSKEYKTKSFEITYKKFREWDKLIVIYKEFDTYCVNSKSRATTEYKSMVLKNMVGFTTLQSVIFDRKDIFPHELQSDDKIDEKKICLQYGGALCTDSKNIGHSSLLFYQFAQCKYNEFKRVTKLYDKYKVDFYDIAMFSGWRSYMAAMSTYPNSKPQYNMAFDLNNKDDLETITIRNYYCEKKYGLKQWNPQTLLVTLEEGSQDIYKYEKNFLNMTKKQIERVKHNPHYKFITNISYQNDTYKKGSELVCIGKANEISYLKAIVHRAKRLSNEYIAFQRRSMKPAIESKL